MRKVEKTDITLYCLMKNKENFEKDTKTFYMFTLVLKEILITIITFILTLAAIT